MLDFCGQDYNPTSHETNFTRSADAIRFYLIKFLFNAVNVQVSADTPSSAEIEMAAQAIDEMSEAIKSTEIANAITENPNTNVAEANNKSENPTDIEEKANAIAEYRNANVADVNDKTEIAINIEEKANAIEENRNKILRMQTRLKN